MKILKEYLMKIALTSLLIVFSVSAFASSKPCQNQARKVVMERLGDVAEDSDCEVKLSKKHQSEDEVSYKANISCVGEGGFFDMYDFVVLKYKKLASGKYSCNVQ